MKESIVIYEFVESLAGLKPHSIKENPITKQPISKVNYRGLICTIIHIFLFAGCTFVTMMVNNNVISVIDTKLAKTETFLMNTVKTLNTILIFSDLLWKYKAECKMFVLAKAMDLHLSVIGINMRHLYFKIFVVCLTMAAVFTLLLSSYFVNGLYFWAAIQENTILASVHIISMVMPTIYMEMVLIQFILIVLYIRMRVHLLNNVLLKVYDREQLKCNKQNGIINDFVL